MPEFVLNDTPAPRAYDKLSTFAKAYVEAVFFTNGDTGDDNESRLNDLGVERLTREAIRDIASDCDSFLGFIMPDGCFVRQWLDRLAESHGYSEEQAGHDLWFSRQGHGVGYWDRGLGDAGDALHKAAKTFSEAYCEVYRGWIYHR